MEYLDYEKIIFDHLKRVEPERDYSSSPDVTSSVRARVQRINSFEWVTRYAWGFEKEKEMLAYISDNPDAKVDDLEAYLLSILTPLEIVDDDEMDEDEE